MRTLPRFVILLHICLLLVTQSLSQSNGRGLNEDEPAFQLRNTPIKIVGRKVGTKTFARGEKVSADVAWLKNLELTVKNISDKDILYFRINLVIPKAGRLDKRVAIPVRFGIPYKTGDGKVIVPGRPRLLPNQDTTVSVTREDIERFTGLLRRYDAADFDSVIVEIRDVDFDGGGWSLGNLWEEDSRGNTRIVVPNEKTDRPPKEDLFNWLKSLVPVMGNGRISVLTAVPPTVFFSHKCLRPLPLDVSGTRADKADVVITTPTGVEMRPVSTVLRI